MNKIIIMFVILLLSDLAVAGGRSGNGGSSKMDKAIRFALKGIELVMRDLKATDYDLALEKMEKRCVYNEFLSKDQAGACAELVVNSIDQIAMLASGPRKVKVITTSGDDERFKLRVDHGTKIVAATTENSHVSPIYLNYDMVRNFSGKELVALLYHELAHKVKFQGEFINDEIAVGGFDLGKDLLDAAGFAVSKSVWLVDENFWRQFRGETELDWFRCELETVLRWRKVLRWSEKRLPLNEDTGIGYVTGIAHREPHGVDITDLVAPVLGDEAIGKTYHFRLAIIDQGNCNDYAKRSTQMELAILDKTTNELDVPTEAWNESLVCKERSTFKWEISDLLTIECKFEGQHRR